MASVDLNDIATNGIQTLQGSIDLLNQAKVQPGADIGGIVKQIEDLEEQQEALRDMALGTIQATDANKQAIAAVSAAAASLNVEAANITDVATALANDAKVINAAASLVTALTPFA